MLPSERVEPFFNETAQLGWVDEDESEKWRVEMVSVYNWLGLLYCWIKWLLSAGTFSPIAVLKIYLPIGQVVRAFSVVRPKIYLSQVIGRVGISSPDEAAKRCPSFWLCKATTVPFKVRKFLANKLVLAIAMLCPGKIYCWSELLMADSQKSVRPKNWKFQHVHLRYLHLHLEVDLSLVQSHQSNRFWFLWQHLAVCPGAEVCCLGCRLNSIHFSLFTQCKHQIKWHSFHYKINKLTVVMIRLTMTNILYNLKRNSLYRLIHGLLLNISGVLTVWKLD